jgi:glycosyltransferase involved in cell wall biosynthesis
MNVLQIVAAPTQNGKQKVGINGPERRTANLVNKWKAYDINPIICYPNWGKLWRIFEQACVPLIDFDSGSKYNWRAPGAICAIAKKYNADLIHTQGSPGLDLCASIAGRISHIPIVITRPSMIEHNKHYSYVNRHLYRYVDQITLRNTSRIIAVSESGKEYLRNVLKIPPSKLKLIYNGIQAANFIMHQHNNYTGGGQDPPVVLGMLAQLTLQKGWNDFLSVIHRLNQKGYNIRGMIVGAGPLWDELHNNADKCGLSKLVHFTGSQEIVAPFLAQMDIFLFTSHREGLSLAILEAMASGLPIIATDVGGTREQVQQEYNGFVVPSGEIDTFVRHSIRLITEPKLRSAQGMASRCIVEEKFKEERMLSEYAECYYEAVEKYQR